PRDSDTGDPAGAGLELRVRRKRQQRRRHAQRRDRARGERHDRRRAWTAGGRRRGRRRSVATQPRVSRRGAAREWGHRPRTHRLDPTTRERGWSTMSELFIRRPVMTILVMLGILVFGVVAYRSLPISDLPTVDYPTINVNASLAGASPETMAAAVATPLEKQFSTIAGIDNMTSSSTLGSVSITLQFTLDRDIDAAAQDVQAAIA